MRRYGVRLFSSIKKGGVNGPHASDSQPNLLIGFQSRDNSVNVNNVSKRHWDDNWGKEEIEKSIFAHSMATWAPGSSLRSVPLFVRGEGIYLIDETGKKHIDLTSQVNQSLLFSFFFPSLVLCLQDISVFYITFNSRVDLSLKGCLRKPGPYDSRVCQASDCTSIEYSAVRLWWPCPL